MTEYSSDPFWGDNPNILIETDRLAEFFPGEKMSLPERVNSVARLIIYVSVTISVYQNDYTSLKYGALLLFLIYFLWYKKNSSGAIEKFTDVDAGDLDLVADMDCQMPTKNNPFMNQLPFDPKDRGPACQIPGVAEMSENLLRDSLFQDIDTLYEKNANERLFMTNPSTSKVPDREKFANWLFAGENNCKEDGNCDFWQDLRLNRKDPAEAVQGFSF